MTYPLTLDFETSDPSIARKRGGGWVYADFEILGAAYQKDGQAPVFTSDMDEVRSVVTGAKSIICHNAQYDIGCLRRLQIPFRDKLIIDTMIMAKLFDNSIPSYSLDALASDFLGERKDYAALEEAGHQLGIAKPLSKMKELYTAFPELVARYAKQDVSLTYRLSQWFKKELYSEGLDLLPMFSDLIKALVEWRFKGVRIDLVQAEKSSAILSAMQEEALAEFYTYCPNVNIESTKQLAEAFRALGLEPGISAKGGDSVDSKWRATQDHPAIVALSNAKKYQKLRREFVDGIVDRSENGRIFPEMNILGAVETGRMSSANPNIQQLPKRDELAAELVRSIFLPEEGTKWYSLDFASQEPRLQVGYAYLAQCEGADILLNSYRANAQHDLHQQVAELAKIDRRTAKTINLGMSYGMGVSRLSVALKLSETQAIRLIDQYKTLTPYLAQLNKMCQAAGIKRGYIKTLLGRRLTMDMEKPYKALNKLIQGSAADMTMLCLAKAYREGLPVMFSVHDSIELSCTDEQQALLMKEIMEKSFDFPVPFYTDILSGENWGEAG